MFNLDIEDFPLSEEFKVELDEWLEEYKEIPMDEHNKKGFALKK